MPRKSTKTLTPKAAMVRGLALLQGKDLADICRRSGVHRSVFYRVIRGERTSDRVDRLISRELGIAVKVLRDTRRNHADGHR